MRFISVLICCCMLGLLSRSAYAISFDQNAKRYEIDAKRVGVSYMSRDALPRSREFKQIDSTYYVGWMYEGAYRMDHAADALGFKLAAESLQKALDLLEHDFDKELRTRTGDAMRYIEIMTIHRDWDFIQYALYQSYTYSNQIEAAWMQLRKASIINVQDELMTETYNLMAWTVHRHRRYTSKDYSFLKNSIAENEAYAHQLLDSSLQKIIRDQQLMESFLAINYRQEREPGIWHYRAILHGYALNIPKAAACYKQLKETVYFPENNFATFNLIQGNFNEAAIYYNEAKENEGNDKRLKESYYYGSILELYRNNIPQGIKELNEVIQSNGSTPGFGWYQLALARLYLYNGQLHAAGNALKKASHFHEIHMGTTLGESHYQLTLTTLQIIRWNNLIGLQHQADRYWWLKPDKLWHSIVWYWQRYQDKIRWVDLLKNNPERETVLYNLFSSESTISVDEVLTCLTNMSPQYFGSLFNSKLQQDSLRPALTPYWHYAIAKQFITKKQWKEAEKHLTIGLKEIDIEKNTYLKLLSARCYEALIQCKLGLQEDVPPLFYINWFLQYPQTITTSGIAFPIQCQLESSPELKPISDAIRKSNLNCVNDTQYLRLLCRVIKKGDQPTLQGEWYLPGKNTPIRTCTWTIHEEKPANETVFQPLFRMQL